MSLARGIVQRFSKTPDFLISHPQPESGAGISIQDRIGFMQYISLRIRTFSWAGAEQFRGRYSAIHEPKGRARHSGRAANRVSETVFATRKDCGCHPRFMGTKRIRFFEEGTTHESASPGGLTFRRPKEPFENSPSRRKYRKIMNFFTLKIDEGDGGFFGCNV